MVSLFNLVLELSDSPTLLPEHDTLISIFSDSQYMKNMYNQLLFLKAMRKEEVSESA